MSLFICQRCEAQSENWNGACPACGGTDLLKLSPQVDRMLGRVIAGRYKILRRLGQGGMGSVYLAEQVGIGQQVALKFLNSNLSMDPDVARRFLNEAKSYARVAHPNAVTLHDFGQDEDGTLYICMEYVEGDDLKRLLSNVGRLNVHEAADIIFQVADVLAFAHARQVVHRDLKPENIMVRQGMRGWHVKVLDFGIARVADGATRLTAQGAVAGTPRYMSPEQAMGLDVDARADIYAVGLVLFELLTGKQPYDGSSVAEIMQKQVHQPMPHLADVVPELQYPAIDTVIQKATAKKPVERHPTMQAFAAELSNALPTLTGRAPISGVTPVVKGSETPEKDRSGTMLYGDGSEATLVRGAAAAAGTADAGKYNTGKVPRVAPIPLTQPATDGFDKTAHESSPYAQPKKSRTGLVMGVGMAAVLLVGGAGVVAIRGQGGTGDAVPAQTQVAQAPAPPSVPETPKAPEPVPAATAPVAAPEPVAPVAAAGVGSTAAPDANSERLKREAAELLIKVRTYFAAGELENAELMLKVSDTLVAVEPELLTLRDTVTDAKALLDRAQAQEEEDCDAARKTYRTLKRKHPSLKKLANQGIGRCREGQIPDQME
jgi:serine/threonine-protein kinase